MGNGQRSVKVPVTRNAPSPSDSSLKSCVSGRLDKYVSFQDFWGTLVDLTKNPPDEHLQQQDIKQLSEKELEITKSLDLSTFDVSAMVKLGLQRLLLPTDQLTKWTKKGAVFRERYVIDQDSHTICSERYGPAGNLMERSTTVVHRDPFVVEFWAELPGWRRCGPVVSEVMRDRLLDPAMKRLHGEGYMWHMYKSQRAHKDFIQDGSDALTHKGEFSVVSVPLDAFAEFDTLWLATIDVLRYPDKRPDKSWEIVTVDQMTEEEFMVRRSWDMEDPRIQGLGDQGLDSRDHIKLDRKTGTILAETYNDGVLVNLTWYVIHKDPLRVECWCEGPPSRRAGSFLKQRLLVMLDVVLERCERSAEFDKTITQFVSGDGLNGDPLDDSDGEGRDSNSEDEEGFAEPRGNFVPPPRGQAQMPPKPPQSSGPSKILLHWREQEKLRKKARAEKAEDIRALEERARKLRQEQEKDAERAYPQDEHQLAQLAGFAPTGGASRSSQDHFEECED